MEGIILNLEESQGDWFDFFESHVDLDTGEIIYDDPKPDTGSICFRPTRSFMLERISKRKKDSKFVLNPRTRAMERVEFDKALTPEEVQTEQEDLIDFAITGIKKFFDMESKPIKCTRENKLALVKVPVFDRFMARCMELQLNANVKQAETSEKNLKTA